MGVWNVLQDGLCLILFTWLKVFNCEKNVKVLGMLLTQAHWKVFRKHFRVHHYEAGEKHSQNPMTNMKSNKMVQRIVPRGIKTITTT